MPCLKRPSFWGDRLLKQNLGPNRKKMALFVGMGLISQTFLGGLKILTQGILENLLDFGTSAKGNLGGGFNPSEKYESNWVHLPQVSG